jgi:hypothetical protein
MVRGPCTFRKRDLQTAIKATRIAGIEIGRIEIGKDGKIVIIASDEMCGRDDARQNEPPEHILTLI